jgi:tRNA pseudouridine55 synthase
MLSSKHMSELPKYLTLEKAVGETPLSCAEAYRSEHPELKGVSMAYAGRLDPMASGKLLILLGDECKNQTSYHGLDKEYQFSVLFGIESDSQDVMGRLTTDPNSTINRTIGEKLVDSVARDLTGTIELPYPIFSSKTVEGKPLHTWTMEGRLDEITIPTKESEIYELEFTKLETKDRAEVVEEALAKVNSVPPVTELRKALGNDFRRVDVRKDWDDILRNESLPDTYQIAHFRCVASSGTYMRTLAKVIAKHLNTVGLAWSIHRTEIGRFDPVRHAWSKSF